MWIAKVRLAVAAVLLAGAAGVGGLVYHGLAGGAATAADGPAADQAAASANRHLIDVPSRRDGVLLVVGTEVKDGEQVPEGRLVTVKVGDGVQKYRRLRVGDAVEEGQLLARVDDQVARDELAIKQQEVEATRADREASKKTRDEAEQRYRTMQRLYQGGGAARTVSLEDIRGAKLTWDRYFYEEIGKREAIKKAEAEVRAAETIVKMHEIRSPAVGVITKLYKHRGEAVRAYDPVMQLLVAEHGD